MIKYLVVGLGNPGKEYEKTRHNIGFMVLDELIKESGNSWSFDKKCNAAVFNLDKTLYLKPQTFMNNSGESVAAVVNFYKIALDNLIVCHDDVDLEFFKIKKQLAAGAAGHHGVESVIAHLRTNNFWRIRIGVGRPQEVPMDIEKWVLTSFGDHELNELPILCEKIKNLL